MGGKVSGGCSTGEIYAAFSAPPTGGRNERKVRKRTKKRLKKRRRKRRRRELWERIWGHRREEEDNGEDEERT